MKIKKIIKKILMDPVKEKEKAKFIYKKNVTESLKILEATTKALDKYGIKYYLDYGTLIGAMRDKALIPWDDDMDISLLDPNDKSKLPKVYDYIKNKYKLKVARITFKRSINNRINKAKEDSSIEVYVRKIPFAKETNLRVVKVRNFKFNFLNIRKLNGRNCLDIFVKYPNEDKKTYWMAQNKIHSIDTALIGEKLIEIDFYHLRCKIPANYDEYLTSMYGDWKEPKENWQYYEHDMCSSDKSVTESTLIDKNKYKKPITRELIIPANEQSIKITLRKETLQDIPTYTEDGLIKIKATIRSADNSDVIIDSFDNSISTIIKNKVNKISLLKNKKKDDSQGLYSYLLTLVNSVNSDIVVTLNIIDIDSGNVLIKKVTIDAGNKTTIFGFTEEEEDFILNIKKFKLLIQEFDSRASNIVVNKSYSYITEKTVIPQKIAIVYDYVDNSKNEMIYTLYLNIPSKNDQYITVNISDNLKKSVLIPAGNISRKFTLTRIENEYLELKESNSQYYDNFSLEVWLKDRIRLDKLPLDYFVKDREQTEVLSIDLEEVPKAVNSNLLEYDFKLNRKSEGDTIIALQISSLKDSNKLIEKEITIAAGKTKKRFILNLNEEKSLLNEDEISITISDIVNIDEEKIIREVISIRTNIKEKSLIEISQYSDFWIKKASHSYLVTLTKPSKKDTKVFITFG